MRPYSVVVVLLIVFLLTGCGGSGSTTPATSVPTTPTTPTTPTAPVFTSTPVTQAAEGTPYSYQLTASGTGVVFSLTSAPAGATLSGSTITWTPTSAQSRVPNSFTATATVSGAPSAATQSWTVNPSGIIRITRIDTRWNESGSTNQPFDWSSVSSSVAALVPQPDGSFQSLSGTAGANGTFQIPGVPAGYYWLKLGPRDTYWTSSSTFDMGSDVFVPVTNAVAPTVSTTNISLNFTSLDATTTPSLLRLDTPEQVGLAYLGPVTAGFTTAGGNMVINGNLDLSVIKNAFVRQYEPTAFGSTNGYVMGPELTLSNLSLTTGGNNSLSGALNPTVPASINLSIKGSAWASLINHVAPTASAATMGGRFNLSVQPFIAADGPNVSLSNPIDLLWANSNIASLLSSLCSTNTPLTTDINAGAVQYSDPFPPAWRRVFSVCQNASVTVPVPGGTSQTINLINVQTTPPPTATVTPLISPVQNPKINGTDLFTASTVSSTAPVTLTWDPPAIGTPFGYLVSIMTPTTLSDGSVQYLSSTTLSTAKTSMTLPTSSLVSGRTYLLVITAVVDAKANMETSPYRSSLPTASAQLMSAPITAN